MIIARLATSHGEVLRKMSGAHGLIVSALAALCLSLALSACGDRASESLKPGPLTPEARKRAAELGDDRTFLEARQALRGFGRDAVPALVEVLEGWAGPQSKWRAAEVLGDLGVAAEASIPILQNLKVKGSSELSVLVAAVILRIEQWRACGLAGLPDDTEVHLVGVYKGQKELDLQLGESGNTTTEINVVVGRVPRPVILVLVAYDPVVWRVGYTSQARIAGVLVSGYHTPALIGIPRSTPHRVLSFEQTRGCEPFYDVYSSAASAACASPRAITMREQTLLGVRGRGSIPLVTTWSCSTVASAAIADAISSTAGSGS
jgi:hypothetical protein